MRKGGVVQALAGSKKGQCWRGLAVSILPAEFLVSAKFALCKQYQSSSVISDTQRKSSKEI
jgi:hypothetical protein